MKPSRVIIVLESLLLSMPSSVSQKVENHAIMITVVPQDLVVI
jgi:hypothetical protein